MSRRKKMEQVIVETMEDEDKVLKTPKKRSNRGHSVVENNEECDFEDDPNRRMITVRKTSSIIKKIVEKTYAKTGCSVMFLIRSESGQINVTCTNDINSALLSESTKLALVRPDPGSRPKTLNHYTMQMKDIESEIKVHKGTWQTPIEQYMRPFQTPDATDEEPDDSEYERECTESDEDLRVRPRKHGHERNYSSHKKHKKPSKSLRKHANKLYSSEEEEESDIWVTDTDESDSDSESSSENEHDTYVEKRRRSTSARRRPASPPPPPPATNKRIRIKKSASKPEESSEADKSTPPAKKSTRKPPASKRKACVSDTSDQAPPSKKRPARKALSPVKQTPVSCDTEKDAAGNSVKSSPYQNGGVPPNPKKPAEDNAPAVPKQTFLVKKPIPPSSAVEVMEEDAPEKGWFDM